MSHNDEGLEQRKQSGSTSLGRSGVEGDIDQLLTRLQVLNTVRGLVMSLADLRGLSPEELAYREDNLKKNHSVTQHPLSDLQAEQLEDYEKLVRSNINRVKSYVQEHDPKATADLFAQVSGIWEPDDAMYSPHPQSLRERINSSFAVLKSALHSIKSGNLTDANTRLEELDSMMSGHWALVHTVLQANPGDDGEDDEEDKLEDDEEEATCECQTATSNPEAHTDSEEEDPEEKADSESKTSAKEDTADDAESHLAKLSI